MNKEVIVREIINKVRNDEKLDNKEKDYLLCIANDWFLFKQRIDKVASDLGHELYGHILQNDEETWNEEYYTDGKLDYRKLLIDLLEEVFKILEVDGSKWYNYDRK